jgi:hypothetical protein
LVFLGLILVHLTSLYLIKENPEMRWLHRITPSWADKIKYYVLKLIGISRKAGKTYIVILFIMLLFCLVNCSISLYFIYSNFENLIEITEFQKSLRK